jgi:hypothetical protein
MIDQAVLRMLRHAVVEVRRTNKVAKAVVREAEQLLQTANRLEASIVLGRTERE